MYFTILYDSLLMLGVANLKRMVANNPAESGDQLAEQVNEKVKPVDWMSLKRDNGRIWMEEIS